MAQYPVSYPDIAGKRYQFASLSLTIPGYVGPMIGLQSISYNSKRDPGQLRGTSPLLMGVTTGKLDFGGSLEVPVLEGANLLDAITAGAVLQSQSPLNGGPPIPQGYLQYTIPTVTVSYWDINQPMLQDVISGMFLVKDDSAHKKGQEPLYTKFDFMAFYIQRNGEQPYQMTNAFGIAGV